MRDALASSPPPPCTPWGVAAGPGHSVTACRRSLTIPSQMGTVLQPEGKTAVMYIQSQGTLSDMKAASGSNDASTVEDAYRETGVRR